MRTLIRLALGVTALLLLFGAAGLVSAEPYPAGTTTWRPGDEVVYSAGCHEAITMEAAADGYERGNADLFIHFVQQGMCFIAAHPQTGERVQIPAKLIERVSETYCVPDGPCGSVWRVLDILGDIEFILLADDAGPHAPDSEA